MGIKFRKYQREMIRAQDAFMADDSMDRAVILAATGAGKTEVYWNLIEKTFKSDIGKGKDSPKRILITHPRIALSQNQQSRFKSYVDMLRAKKGINVEFTGFHSGHAKFHTLPDKKNISTTNRHALEEIQMDAIRSHTHHITFSSYASLHKIADFPFDLVINDEAHYLVQPELRQNLYLFQARKVINYTGTPVTVASGEEHMRNEELFGPIISNIPPKMLIPDRYIVRPRIRTLNVLSDDDDKGNTEDYTSTIAWAFQDQVRWAHPDFTHKMLVAMPNTQYMQDISNDIDEIRVMVGNEDLDIYHVTASTAIKNSTHLMDREDLIEDFSRNPNQSIILHCDTLAEGIDVDGIGGVLIMRSLGKVKAIQTIGRGCRPAIQDIIKSGKDKGEVRKGRIKKECIVTIANFNGEWAGDANLFYYADIFKQAGYDTNQFWSDLKFQLEDGRGEEFGIEREIIYKEAHKCAAAEGQASNFWSFFPVEEGI